MTSEPTRSDRCENCGRPLTAEERAFGVRLCPQCAEIRAEPPPPPPTEGAPPARANELGDFWGRFIAYFIDSFVVNGAALAAGFGIAFGSALIAAALGASDNDVETAATTVFVIVVAVIAIGYVWLGHAHGQTLGKRAMGLGVISKADGRRLGLRRGFVRLIVQSLGALPFYLGWLWSIWDGDKQAWHDKAAGSLVVRFPVYADKPKAGLLSSLAGQAATGVVLLLAIAVATGIVVGLVSDGPLTERDVQAAFDASDVVQEEIDSSLEFCTEAWVAASARNNVDTIERLGSLDDPDAAALDLEDLLRDFCAEPNIAVYCRGYAETISARVDDEVGLQSEIEVGCLQGLRTQIDTGLLAVGQCLVFDINDVYTEVDCAGGDYDALVVDVFDMPSEGAYPGEDEIVAYADENCPLEAETYYYPLPGSWALGNKQIVCLDETP